MKSRKPICGLITVAVVLVQLTFSAHATPDHSTSKAASTAPSLVITKSLLERTGITVQMHLLTHLVDESSRTHAARCSATPAHSSIPGFHAESIIFDTLSTFNRKNTQPLEPIEAWYQSALAQKIQIAEQQSIDHTAFVQFIQSSGYKNPRRKKHVNNIVNNMQIARFVAILGTEVEYAGIVHSGCIGQAAITENPNREQLLADITRRDKALTASILYADIAADTAYLFRGLSAAELAEFDAFTSSIAGRSFYSNLIDAVEISFKRAGDRLTRNRQSQLVGSIDF